MSSSSLLQTIVVALDKAGIPHMLTGSFAAAYYGAGRATIDIDLVIDPNVEQIRLFISSLPSDMYYVSLDAAEEALRHEGLFNIIDIATGWKLDLITRRSAPFSEQEFERRQSVDFQGVVLSIATLEDIILAKLVWARLGESARQMEDVAALLRIRGSDIDRTYVEGWLDALGVRGSWETARRSAADGGEEAR